MMKIEVRGIIFVLFFLILARAATAFPDDKHDISGVVLKVDHERHSLLVSCKSVPGYMDAMVMSFPVRDATVLDSLQPGEAIQFSFVVNGSTGYADNIRTRPFQSLELDPTQTRRLKILESVASESSTSKALAVGQLVPDFKLTDQTNQSISLSQFSGKVVALTFVYTRCPFPNYCFRLTNNFGQLQKRFADRLGKDLTLLTVVIDPANDRPAALDTYGEVWKANSAGWHFLTGSLSEIQMLCRQFDMNFYPDEAVLVHSFHTVLIDRQGRLASNIEGNDFTSKQLGDLVETMIKGAN
jgi:protein SCO1